MSKHYCIIVDTETTKKQTVADFGAVVVDRSGAVHDRLGSMVTGHFGKFDLFSDPTAPSDSLWSAQSAKRRAKDYFAMMENGSRVWASVAFINQWLSAVNAKYSPVFTAYNSAFDLSKCRNTGIDLGIFKQSFCLMKAAKREIGTLAEYQEFCRAYGLVTARGNVRHTADAMAKFVNFSGERYGLMDDEPHTALEDAQFYEALILQRLVSKLTRKQLLEAGK